MEAINDSGQFMLPQNIASSGGFWLPRFDFSFLFLVFADMMITYLCTFKTNFLPCLQSKGSISLRFTTVQQEVNQEIGHSTQLESSVTTFQMFKIVVH